MITLKVADTQDHFVTADGDRFFILGDTMFSAFCNVADDDWEPYLDLRKQQGFNAIAVSLHHMWDGGESPLDLYPFRLDESGRLDYRHPNDAYFQRAERMVEAATKKGFIMKLGVLHHANVPGSHSAKRRPEYVMPLELVKPWVQYMAQVFGKYKPILGLGGEFDWADAVVLEYQWALLEALKTYCPDSLLGLFTYPPMESQSAPQSMKEQVDFYTYEVGHNVETQTNCYAYARMLYESPIKHPIIDTEYSYDGHGFGNSYGRFNEFDIRKGAWWSLLSGAKAGLTYGAHGVWGWYDGEREFLNEGYGSKAYNWRTALRFKGAWEASFARWAFENYDLFDLEPVYGGILNKTDLIRMAASPDGKKVVIYVPYNIEVKVNRDLSDYDFTLIGMADKNFAKPRIVTKEGVSTVKMWDFNSDGLLVGMRK